MRKLLSSIIFSSFLISVPSSGLKASHDFVDDSGVEWKQQGSFSVFCKDNGDTPLERKSYLWPVNKNETQIKEIFLGSYRDAGTLISVSLNNENRSLRERLAELNLGESRLPFTHRDFWSLDNVNLADYLDVFVEFELMDQSLKQKILAIIDVEPDQESKLEMLARKLARKERLKAITEVNKIGQPLTDFSINARNTFAVLEQQFAVASAEDKFPILATFGAQMSVIAAFYNQSNHMSSLGHLDVLTNVNRSLKIMYQSISENDNDNIIMHLAGGNTESADLQLEILDWVSSNNVRLESCKLNKRELIGEQLALDSRTGKISSYFSAQDIAHHRDYEAVICGLPYDVNKGINSPLTCPWWGFVE